MKHGLNYELQLILSYGNHAVQMSKTLVFVKIKNIAFTENDGILTLIIDSSENPNNVSISFTTFPTSAEAKSIYKRKLYRKIG